MTVRTRKAKCRDCGTIQSCQRKEFSRLDGVKCIACGGVCDPTTPLLVCRSYKKGKPELKSPWSNIHLGRVSDTKPIVHIPCMVCSKNPTKGNKVICRRCQRLALIPIDQIPERFKKGMLHYQDHIAHLANQRKCAQCSRVLKTRENNPETICKRCRTGRMVRICLVCNGLSGKKLLCKKCAKDWDVLPLAKENSNDP
jgi:hypothetical protein